MSRTTLFSTIEGEVYENRFRRKRLARFLAIADDIIAAKGKCHVLDVGGLFAYWKGLEGLWRDRSLHITLVNLRSEQITDPRFTSLSGDARDLGDLRDNSYDVVHSNSVIEHVRTWDERCKMAREIRRLAPRYYVQTPNIWFPLELHFRAPFIHWLPEPWRVAAVMRWALGFYPRARSVDEAYRIIEDARLLDAKAMAALFPDAHIARERVALFTKSLIAIR